MVSGQGISGVGKKRIIKTRRNFQQVQKVRNNMRNIELVITIPEEEYNTIKNSNIPMYWAEHLIKKVHLLHQKY